MIKLKDIHNKIDKNKITVKRKMGTELDAYIDDAEEQEEIEEKCSVEGCTRRAREEAKKKYDRIYNACLLDKGPDVDMQVNALRKAVEETCEAISEDPSFYESWKYE